MSLSLNRRLWSWTGAAVLAAGAAGVVAPSLFGADEKVEAPAAVAATYIGELKGAPESARIAVVVEGGKFVAYVCSNDQPFNDAFSRWFRGDTKAGKMSVKADNGATVTASATDDAITGTLTKDGKSHEFTAKRITGDANAGLFRAAESVGDDAYVIGWIADETGAVVGTGGKRGGPVQTLQAPKGTNNLNPQVGDKKLEPGKVTGAGTGANTTNTGKKIDPALKAEMLQDLIADRKATGGNAVQAMLIHQMRRFNAGKKPETKLEEKVFAALKAAPKDMIAEYLKDWDKIPKADRDTLIGAANVLDANKGLDDAQAKKLVAGMPQLRSLRAGGTPRSLSGSVKAVSAPTVKCVDETNPEIVGKDEIFAIHTVIVGSGEPQTKKTAILKGFDDGVTKTFAAADAAVFPQPGQSPAEGAEVFIVTTLYEDDGAGVQAILNFLKPLFAAAVVTVVEVKNGEETKLSEFEKAAIKLAVDAVVTGAGNFLADRLVQPLGTDSITARPDGSLVADNGGAKTKMRFRKVKNGDVKYDYELSGFAVQK